MKRDDAERMVGRAVIESMKRSVQAREVFRKMLGDLMDNVPLSEDEYETIDADLVETPDELVAFFDLPGTSKEKIDLGVTEDAITVETSFDRPAGRYVLRERGTETVSRKIKLPEEVKPEQVKAKYENGVLEVHLPKLIVVKPREVKIE